MVWGLWQGGEASKQDVLDFVCISFHRQGSLFCGEPLLWILVTQWRTRWAPQLEIVYSWAL